MDRFLNDGSFNIEDRKSKVSSIAKLNKNVLSFEISNTNKIELALYEKIGIGEFKRICCCIK